MGPVARQLAEEGIEVVKANLESREETQKAFTGAYAVCKSVLAWCRNLYVFQGFQCHDPTMEG